MIETEANVTETVHWGEKLAGRYVTFILSGEEYCVEIKKVQQIIQMEDITLVPRSPDYIKGVINLRGKVVPIIDLRVKFDMNVAEANEKNCIVVLQAGDGKNSLTVGVIFDEVKEVTQIKGINIDEVPSFGEGIDVAFLMGMAKIGESVRMLLDVDSLFSKEVLINSVA